MIITKEMLIEQEPIRPHFINKPRYHPLKTWLGYFQAIYRGDKTFEIRENDRDYQVGDYLCLLEYNPDCETYTSRTLVVVVTYIFNLSDNFVVMAIRKS